MLSLNGQVHTWNLGGFTRKYSNVTLTFREFREYVECVRFNAERGRGEQRAIMESHVRGLRKAMESGEYTPCPMSVGLKKKQKDDVKFGENNTFELTLEDNKMLSQTDGGHRVEVLGRILDELNEKLSKAKEEEKAEVQQEIDNLLSQPVSFTLYLDGDTQEDFLNLQKGRSVDKSHILAMSVKRREVDDPAVVLAFEVAKLLHKAEDSPFHNSVRLDSFGSAPLPISTLCSRGASDLGTSLVGLARVALNFEKKPDAAKLAATVCRTYNKLKEEHPTLLEASKALSTIANGTKGSATMMIGLASCGLYRMEKNGETLPSDETLSKLASSANKVMNRQIRANFSGPVKRELLGSFAKDFFNDLTEEKHEGLPVGFVKSLSCSTLAVNPLPKKPTASNTENTQPKTVTVDESKDFDPETVANTQEELQAVS